MSTRTGQQKPAPKAPSPHPGNMHEDTGTTARILSAAVTLFAERGIDKVTIRAIADRSETNIAAVNYYFRSKDNLSVEVFRAVARRSAERRLAALDTLLQQAETAGAASPPLDRIIGIFVDAYVNVDHPEDGALLSQLILKHRAAPTDWTHSVVRDELDPLADRYIRALAATAPHLETAEVHWRYHMMVGAIVLMLNDRGIEQRLHRLSGGQISTKNRDQLRAALIRFCTNAFGSSTPDR